MLQCGEKSSILWRSMLVVEMMMMVVVVMFVVESRDVNHVTMSGHF